MATLTKHEKQYIKRELLRGAHIDAAHVAEARSNAKKATAAGDDERREYWRHIENVYKSNIDFTYKVIKKLEV